MASPKKRRGRGVDFQQRFSASRWAEDRLFDALNAHLFVCVRIGLSGFTEDNLVATVSGEPKVPDLIVIRRSNLDAVQLELLRQREFDLIEASVSDFEDDGLFAFVLREALCAVEVEFSPYRAAEMKGREWKTRTDAAFDKRPLKTAKSPIAPNIYVKEEDVEPLLAWQASSGIPVVVIHVFDQEAFAIELDGIRAVRTRLLEHPESHNRICHTTGIFREVQSYDRTDAQGAGEKKVVFKVTPAAARRAGSVLDVDVKAQLGLSSSKKYVSQVLFAGGRVDFDPEFIEWLNTLTRRN